MNHVLLTMQWGSILRICKPNLFKLTINPFVEHRAWPIPTTHKGKPNSVEYYYMLVCSAMISFNQLMVNHSPLHDLHMHILGLKEYTYSGSCNMLTITNSTLNIFMISYLGWHNHLGKNNFLTYCMITWLQIKLAMELLMR